MTQVLKVTSPMPPSVNHYTNIRVVKKGRAYIPVVFKTKEARDYEKVFKKILQQEAKRQIWNIEVNSTQHFYVDAVFYFDRVDKDTSNYDKCLLDTITDSGIVWKDDNVALFRPLRIYYDNSNPRIELTIYPVDYVGIFDNKKYLEAFEHKCNKCTRYKRNCSILKKAKEGRVQEYINKNLECNKFKEAKE